MIYFITLAYRLIASEFGGELEPSHWGATLINLYCATHFDTFMKYFIVFWESHGPIYFIIFIDLALHIRNSIPLAFADVGTGDQSGGSGAIWFGF